MNINDLIRTNEEEIFCASVAVERRIPKTGVIPDKLEEKVLSFYRSFMTELSRDIENIRIICKRPDDKGRIILFPGFFCGIGDWVLINQLMRHIKKENPDHMIAAAVCRTDGFFSVYSDICRLNPDIDILIEIPWGSCRDFDIHGLFSAKNDYGVSPLVWAEALLLLFLKDYAVEKIYKYTSRPLLLNHKNEVKIISHAQHLLDIQKIFSEHKNIPGLQAQADRIALAWRTFETLDLKGHRKIMLHVKFQEDLDLFIDVFDSLAQSRDDFSVFRVGREDLNVPQRSWLCDLFNEKYDIRDVAGLLQGSDLFCGNISGPMHLAAALGKKCVTVYFREFTGLLWDPVLPGNMYRAFYKKAIGHDGLEIKSPRNYGIKNKNVKCFEQVDAGDVAVAINAFL